MFYLTLRKRKLSPVRRDASANAAGRREWDEDYYRLMESAVAGRSDLIARTKAGLCVEDAANTNS